MRRVITVDGPAGSGKTTLGLQIAERLRLPFVDTGLFYRAVAVAAARAGIDAADGRGLTELTRAIRIDVETDPALVAGGPLVSVDGARVSNDDLVDPTRLEALARVSATSGVRQALLAAQRALAVNGAVAAGRDCGTVVFPDAPLKIYLDAPELVRSGRRAAQLQAAGRAVDAGVLIDEVRVRDRRDRTRTQAPLQRAPDAYIIDTDELDVDEMVKRVLALCAERGLVAG